MDIVVDIGNTNVVIGFYKNDKYVKLLRFITKKDGESKLFYDLKIRDELLGLENLISPINGIYLSSVVPQLTNELSEVLYSIFDVVVVKIGANSYSKIKLSIDKPSQIGTDLVANAVAAVNKYKSGCIVVDFGTALTFTVVSKSFEILGVAIAPGLKTSMSALYSKTAQLPEVPLKLPKTVVGKNTTHAIQSGVLWGYVGLVKEMIARIKAENSIELISIATGGLSSILFPLKEIFHEIDSNLTLDGIRIIGSELK